MDLLFYNEKGRGDPLVHLQQSKIPNCPIKDLFATGIHPRDRADQIA